MRILITGTAGQVGAALAERLTSLGQVIPLSRRELDLSRVDQLARELASYAPDLIINPAAYTQVDNAEEEKAQATSINSIAPGVMARWAASTGVPLVHFSTDYVFDGTGEAPWRETDWPSPLSHYGYSKWMGERAVIESGCDHLIIRTSWVYSERGNNFLKTVMRLAAEREELKVVSDQVGAPTSADQIAHALGSILADYAKSPRRRLDLFGSIFHVAARGETSWFGFAKAIIERLRDQRPIKLKRLIPIKSEEYASRAVRPKNSRLDTNKLIESFGVKLSGWEEELDAQMGKIELGVSYSRKVGQN